MRALRTGSAKQLIGASGQPYDQLSAMTEQSKDWYIADPVHQFVDFGPHRTTIKGLVSTPAFQRLRRISQLGLASYVFPGAVHTRFSHSLGAAYLAGVLVRQLGIEDSDGRAIVCAALLHDVGHGPFSHSFERALKRIVPGAPKHEHWTRVIVQQVLSEELQKHDVDPARVCALIKHRDDDPEVATFHRQIISSQLDVDRMDYLCRDAHFAGVPLGRVDLQYLIRNVCVVEHGSQRTLGLMTKGVACYEAFAFARHIMNRSVYFHKQVATFECMMEECIRLLTQGDRTGFEPELVSALRKAKQAETDAVEGLLFKPYLRVTEDQIWTAIGEVAHRVDRLGRLATSLLRREAVPSYRVVEHKHHVLTEELRRKGFDEEQCSVRTLPSSLYNQESGEQVFLNDGQSVPAVHISERSSLVDALRDRAETDAVLVIFDHQAEAAILDVARAANCLPAERTDDHPELQAKSPVKAIKRNGHVTKRETSAGRKRHSRAHS